MKNKIFFILSTGRCGSLWLARLLNQGENALVVHEIDVSDRKAFLEAYSNEAKAFAYIRNYRARIINQRSKKALIYGEVNGVIRYHLKALRAYFPQATFIHLRRDGRDVVRSWLSRDTLNGKDDLSKIVPRKSDPFSEVWKNFTRFSRVCWLWASENEFIRTRVPDFVKFEELVSNYDYFRTELLSRIGISISPQAWDRARSVRENATSKYKIAHHSGWDNYQRVIFEALSGSENRESGYE